MPRDVVRVTRGIGWSLASSFCAFACLVLTLVLADFQPARALPVPHSVRAIPAFARKYGLPCSACHTAWPELNYFGMAFRDRGYQLGNDRDSPIWQNPSYFPITIRITPQWHRESTDQQLTDGAITGANIEQKGFDLSGMDFWLTGTLYKNISFSVLPSSDSTATFHFENAFVRFDNLAGSEWLNLRGGRFELDNLISEKRFLFLSANGGLYQNYHFIPAGDSNNFGIGDNQMGVELQGHSANSYTRYTVAMLASNEGGVGLTNSVLASTAPSVANVTGKTYDFFASFTQGFQTGSLGLQRIEPFVYYGHRPTIFNQTVGGVPIAGTGTGNKPFYRLGVQSDFYLGKFEVLPFFQHAEDNVYLANSIPAGTTLSPGMQNAVWNGGFVETHYYWSPQLVLTQRVEIVRMAQQAYPIFPAASPFAGATVPRNYGNINAYSFGTRWYPIMFSRAGLALHAEYSIVKGIGIEPLSLDGSGVGPLTPTTPVWSSSVFLGFDFDF
jgi:hypothetical protein